VGTFRASTAFEAALRLETMGRQGDLKDGESAWHALEAAVRDLTQALTAIVEGNPSC
jgi:hypothetical protein